MTLQVVIYSPTKHYFLDVYLAALHLSCITHDRTIATFVKPLDSEKLLAYWKKRIMYLAEYFGEIV